MKKIFIYIIAVFSLLSFVACADNDIDENNSIFDTNPPERNEFDKWILKNITTPYNIDVKYKMEDIESSMQHDLTPAKIEQSIKAIKIIKFLWLEVYSEATYKTRPRFIQQYCPRIIHFIGSPGYNNNNTITLGTAEGGLKVTLYDINNLRVDAVSLNERYLHTMHHEFAHILHQEKYFSTEYQKISEGKYVGGSWYLTTEANALKAGFVTSYSMNNEQEDFVEVYSRFITKTPAQWDALLVTAGDVGRPIIERKLGYVTNYLRDSWTIDILELRDIIQRRSSELDLIDLENLD